MQAKNWPHDRVVIRCDQCGREGRYSKERFIEKVGPDTAMHDALSIVAADCPKAGKPSNVLHDRCQARYVRN